jgi:hypothetical protein
MDITRVATLMRDGARPWELPTTHIVHAVTPYDVACNVVLFILTVSIYGLLTALVVT